MRSVVIYGPNWQLIRAAVPDEIVLVRNTRPESPAKMTTFKEFSEENIKWPIGRPVFETLDGQQLVIYNGLWYPTSPEWDLILRPYLKIAFL